MNGTIQEDDRMNIGHNIQNSKPIITIIDMSNLIYRSMFVTMKDMRQRGDVYQPFADEDEKVSHADTWLSAIMSSSLSSLIYVHKVFKNASPCFAFDSPSRAWRYDIFPEYKESSRTKVRTPEEKLGKELSHVCMQLLYEFFSKKTWAAALSVDRAEADDIISRFSEIYNTGDVDIVIVSGDSDFEQLVGENVSLFKPIKKELVTQHGNYVLVGDRETKQYPREDQIVLFGKYWAKIRNPKTGGHIVIDPAYRLFEKCIRGDKSDSIPSAYPRVRTKSLKEAFFGGTEKFNNFINSTYGENKVSVRAQYDFNRSLIDMKMIPEEIITRIDSAILKELTKRKRPMVGLSLSKFCDENHIHREVATSQILLEMLTSPPILP